MNVISDEYLERFGCLLHQSSPENLSCDGELDDDAIAARREQIALEWAAIEREIGFTVSVEQFEAHCRREKSPEMKLKEAIADYSEWKARANRNIPDLAARIFALRVNGRPQRRQEMLLGKVMAELNDHEYLGRERRTVESVIADQIISELQLEELFIAVKKMEQRKKRT